GSTASGGVSGLPGPGYPLGVRRPGASAAPAPEPWPDEASAPGGEGTPVPGAGETPLASVPGWDPPDSVTTLGRAASHHGVVVGTVPMKIVERQSQADEISKSVQSLLERKFGMALDAPFRLVVAGKEDRTVRIERNVAVIMALERGEDGGWVGRIAS